MGEGQSKPVQVSVTLIVRGGKLLAAYNPKWGSFTLPMTKVRLWEDLDVEGVRWREEWPDAAGRAAAEWLGRTDTQARRFLLDVADFQQSDRDGKLKYYHFRVFAVFVDEGASLAPGAVAEWLTVEEWLDEDRWPISPTGRYLIQRLRTEADQTGGAFPPEP